MNELSIEHVKNSAPYKELQRELSGALECICNLCCQINPQHKSERERGVCRCAGTDNMRELANG